MRGNIFHSTHPCVWIIETYIYTKIAKTKGKKERERQRERDTHIYIYTPVTGRSNFGKEAIYLDISIHIDPWRMHVYIYIHIIYIYTIYIYR